MKRMKKSDDIKIKVAKITIVGLIAAAIIYQSPTWYEAWEERPIVEFSFGDKETFPKSVLQQDGSNYFIDIVMRNRGENDAQVLLLVNSTGAKISNNENGPWEYQQSLLFTIRPEPENKFSQIYVQPEKETFVVQLQADTGSNSHYFQETYNFIPTMVTYKKLGNNYELIDQR